MLTRPGKLAAKVPSKVLAASMAIGMKRFRMSEDQTIPRRKVPPNWTAGGQTPNHSSLSSAIRPPRDETATDTFSGRLAGGSLSCVLFSCL